MKTLICLSGLALAALPGARGATETRPAPPAPPALEELYRGEFDDTGPQYLLVPTSAPPARRITLWARTDGSWTDNSTYAESSSSSTTVASFQTGGEWRGQDRPLAGGRLHMAAGARAQIFRYGLVDDDQVVDYLQVDRNNFDLAGLHLRAAWQRGSWLATSSLQGSLLHNRSSSRTFYRELAWDAGLFRSWTPCDRANLLAGLELGHRWTTTDTYGLLPRGWNDRADLALSLLWHQPLRARWSWRTHARAQLTGYSHADRSRRDLTGTLGTELAWTWREACDLRLFVSHERRDSTESAIHDYARWEAGAGAGVRWQF